MKQPIKVSLQTYLENFCENFALKCFQLNLTLSFYRFVHFNRFSCFKICKICYTLLPLKQNLLLNPPVFLTLLISGHLFQLFLISNMIMMNFFLKKEQNSYHRDEGIVRPHQRLITTDVFLNIFLIFFFFYIGSVQTRSEDYLF